MIENNNKHYWKNMKDRDHHPEFLSQQEKEFLEEPDVAQKSSPLSRRTFLKYSGFTFAVSTVGCSRAPVEKAIPFLVQPEEVTPGRAYWYASMCGGCTSSCGVLSKNRDGRPIKLEGNPEHPMSKGGLCAVGQASILGLYDSQRLKDPVENGKNTTWEEVDKKIITQLADIKKIKGKSGGVRFLTKTIPSPTLRSQIAQFLGQFSDQKHYAYDSLSCAAILDAHKETHGVRALPHYSFDKAKSIVSFEADFLGTWISPVEFSADYQRGRSLHSETPEMSSHIQFESRMSLTGGNADLRVAVSPRQIGIVMSHLANELAKAFDSKEKFSNLAPCPIDSKKIKSIATQLIHDKGKSLIVCGINDIQLQTLTNFMNHLLGNYEHTLDIQFPSFQFQGKDEEALQLLKEMEAGQVSALFLHGVNPVYELPFGKRFAEAMKKVKLVVDFAERIQESGNNATYICPDHHFLESWIDAEAISGLLTFSQPTIQPLHNTRSILQSLSLWQGKKQTELDILKQFWETSVFPRQSKEKSFESFWNQSVHDGFATVSKIPLTIKPFDSKTIKPVTTTKALDTGKFDLVLYPKVALRDGSHAHNPWLQELPDPISKVVWDNYISFSPKVASELKIKEGDICLLSSEKEKLHLELPALLQPGQNEHTVAVALGYGRQGTDRFSERGPQWIEAKPTVEKGGVVGENAAIFLATSENYFNSIRLDVVVKKTGKSNLLAMTQDHHSLKVPDELVLFGKNKPRPIVKETTLDHYKDKLAGKEDPHGHGAPHHPTGSLWVKDHEYKGAHWGLSIDLSSCTGCSGCVVACQIENNIPVVGKDEVQRHREMQWLRIDRYYAEEEENVEVVHQPMMCQQCDNAPCETVCPVLATAHSSEGLNMQVYNRCVGTRYCANNCPYKARRFNWFDYAHEDKLENMVLNPDVTIRSRGVMEKCTFCVQRIQEAKAEGKRQGLPVKDGDIQPACQQSCPTKAIVFGDMNDPESEISRYLKDPRSYKVLEEINVQPSVNYLAVVRNKPEGESHE